MLTNLFRHIPIINVLCKYLYWFLLLGFKTPKEGCQTCLCACLDPSIRDFSGEYLFNCDIGSPSSYALDDHSSESLWKASQEVLSDLKE